MMKLFILNDLHWKQTQLIYHALAYMNIESLVLHSTREKYMCVGLHQDPRDEINIDYCKKNDIGIFRREIGGGTVLLDNNQIFYHLILNRNHPEVPRIPQNFFKKFLQPVIKTYYDLGISAEYRPLCDLVVNNKKISGNGGGEIGECKVLGGGILFDFDHELMANAVQSSDRMRKRYLEMMKNNMTTLRQELNGIPSKSKVCDILAKKFAELFGPMKIGKLDDEINDKMEELDKQYSSDSWLYQRGAKQIGREIKIREGTFLFHKEFALTNFCGGITCETEENKITKVTFSDQFSMSGINQTSIKDGLIGLEYDKTNIESIITDMIKKQGGVIVA